MTAPGPQGPVDATEPRNVGTGDRATGNGMPEDQRQNVEEDEMPDQREEVADTEMSEGNGSSEMGRNSFYDDFITPNKTAKARSLPEEGTPLMNSFSPIMDLSFYDTKCLTDCEIWNMILLTSISLPGPGTVYRL